MTYNRAVQRTYEIVSRQKVPDLYQLSCCTNKYAWFVTLLFLPISSFLAVKVCTVIGFFWDRDPYTDKVKAKYKLLDI